MAAQSSSSTDVVRQAALHAVNEEFAAALDVLGEAQGLDEDRIRASVLLQMDRADEALDVCNRIIEQSSDSLKAIDFIRRGAALFALDEFEEARTSMQRATAKGAKGRTTRIEMQAKAWIGRCDAELELEANDGAEPELLEPEGRPEPTKQAAAPAAPVVVAAPAPAPAPTPAPVRSAVNPVVQQSAAPSTATSSAAAASLPPAAAPAPQIESEQDPAPAMPVPYGYVGKRIFEWDETPTHVNLTVLAKQTDPSKSRVQVQDVRARACEDSVSGKPLSTLLGVCSQLQVHLWRPEEEGGPLNMVLPLRGRVQGGSSVRVSHRRMAVEVGLVKDTPGLDWGELQQPKEEEEEEDEMAGEGKGEDSSAASGAGAGTGVTEAMGVDGEDDDREGGAERGGGEDEEEDDEEGAGAGAGAKQAKKKTIAPRTYDEWEALAEEAEQEEKSAKPEGDEALMHLFRDIYARSDEATRRAMNKSYQQSNGLCLSTNWKDVAKKDFEDEKKKYGKG